MSSRTNATSKSAVTRISKSPVATCRQSMKKQSEGNPCPESQCISTKYATYEHCSTQIELIVKRKGHKKNPAMVSSSPKSQKMLEQRKKSASCPDRHQSWGQILREGIRPVMKEGVQGLSAKTHAPSAKLVRPRSKSRDAKQSKDASEHHRSKDRANEQKKRSPRRKVDACTNSAPPGCGMPCTSVGNNADSIYVMDKAVQSDGIFDHSGARFNGYNPVRTLGFLMKELEHSVKDEKAAKILSEMQQVLLKIPIDRDEAISLKDLESAALQSKLETCTMQLEKTSKEMNSMCECLREERDYLHRQVHKQASLLNEAREKELYLENTIKKLKSEYEEMEKAIQFREKTIHDLKNDTKGYEYSQKLLEDLRANLNEQTELARQRQLDIQYLTLERDKLSVLCSYKDALLMELRNSIKDLQNNIAGQLNTLKSTYMQDEIHNPQASLIHGGLACSSPTSASSHDSNLPTSWQDISDVSASTVEHNLPDEAEFGRYTRKEKKTVHSTDDMFHERQKRPTKNGNDTKAKDSMQLEFISLPGGECSQTMLPSYREAAPVESGQLGVKEKDITPVSINRDASNQQSCDANGKVTSPGPSTREYRTKSEGSLLQKKAIDVCTSLDCNRKGSVEGRSDVSEGDSTNSKEGLSTKLIGPTITKQFQNIFDYMRHQSRAPVDVPSPPRNYPNPDWSDSTLPSISTKSELNTMQENNV